MTPTLRSVLCATLLLGACNRLVEVGGGVGQPCVSTKCASGLECVASVCELAGSSPGDGGPSEGPPVDAAMHDAALAGDAATSGPADSCGACTTPPDGCHALTGACQGGVCVYDIVPGASCDDGNACTVNDTCSSSGVCQGTVKVCTTPPAPSCNGSTSTTYDESGVCNGGLCVYTSHDSVCHNACTNGTCGADACAGITCTTPPSGCYASTGTCSAGSCTYAYADGASCDDSNACTSADSCGTGVCQGVPQACNTPPANTCKDSSTAQIYSATGSCSAGSCSYSYGYESCAAGCNNGLCASSGWTKATSNTTANLYAVWGSSASAVWAGGLGVMLSYDGAEWEVRNAGLSAGAQVVSIHGTSSSNVFACVHGDYDSSTYVAPAYLIHYDGAAWSTVATFAGQSNACSVYAIGVNDALVYAVTSKTDYGVTTATGTLYRVTNGTVATLATTSDTTRYVYTPQAGIWAFSAADAYIGGAPPQHWDGATLSAIGPSSDAAVDFWGTPSNALFASETYRIVELSAGSWSSLGYNTPSGQTLPQVTGTSAQRIFAAGGYIQSTTGGYVEYFDGTGWTSPVMPTNTAALTDIWAAASGEVFAVGYNGTILKGP